MSNLRVLLMLRVVMTPAPAAAPRAPARGRDTERLRVQLALRPPVCSLAPALRPVNNYDSIKKLL